MFYDLSFCRIYLFPLNPKQKCIPPNVKQWISSDALSSSRFTKPPIFLVLYHTGR